MGGLYDFLLRAKMDLNERTHHCDTQCPSSNTKHTVAATYLVLNTDFQAVEASASGDAKIIFAEPLWRTAENMEKIGV